MGPHPAVAAVRAAVRAALADLEPGDRVLVACSGGPDSTALAAATAFEAQRRGWQAGGITVDHGLQPGSAERAEQVAALLRELGLFPVEIASVSVSGAGGPEAAARRARYAALDAAADRHAARAVLLGHTRDDQAETVLLGLARGSGARSLAGMPARSLDGRYRRPLLGLERSIAREACVAAGLPVWEDPHNADAAYTRVRVRRRVLPVLEQELGPGIAAALARTADLLRADADALDLWADRAYAECLADEEGVGTQRAGPQRDGSERDGPRRAERDGGTRGGADGGDDAAPGDAAAPVDAAEARPEQATIVLQASHLAALPAAVRRRVLRRAALRAGSPATDLFAHHITAVEALVTDWRGQAFIDLPGRVRADRRGGRLRFVSARGSGRVVAEGHGAAPGALIVDPGGRAAGAGAAGNSAAENGAGESGPASGT